MTNILIVDMDNYFSRLYHIHKAMKCKNLEENKELECIFNNAIKTIDYFNNLIKYNVYDTIIFVYDTKESKETNKKLFNEFANKYNIISEGYKGTRKGNPNFITFKKYFQNIIYFNGFQLIGSTEYEADDVIATLSKEYAQNENNNIHILSNDKDMQQILKSNVSIVKGISKKDTENPFTITDFQFDYIDKYEIKFEPKDIILLKAIVGDKSDNIIGLKGIGEKTLFKQIKEFGTIEETKIYKENKEFIDDLSKIIELNENIEGLEYLIKQGNKDIHKSDQYILKISNELKKN